MTLTTGGPVGRRYSVRGREEVDFSEGNGDPRRGALVPVGRRKSVRRSSGAILLRRRRSRHGGETVSMMETSKDRDADDLSWPGRSGWRQVSGAIGWLHPKALVRSAVIEGRILAEYAPGWCSSRTMRWSKQSRRSVPITRSQ